ncbi:MAG TPA: PQQ-dependent sugar dehydrogenase [Patescibacteria group bacterium]|nr:PQQ-dependent sugar dehydrogenase [Patescibacteria group bacterium]
MIATAFLAAPDAARALPPNFSEVVVFDGLTNPTAVRFSPDGRVFVAEKSGLIKVFDSLTSTTPTIVADLTTNVQDFWDRGLLGFALDPDFPVRPYIYVLYTYDFDPFDPSRPAPRWGDTCPDKDAAGNIIGPGATVDGCVVNGRLSRLTVNPDNTLEGGEHVLLENNWCQQFPSHTVGSIVFGPEGALYVSAGDGANFNTADWGQFGGSRGTPPYTPANPCGDPNRPRGTATSRPGAEGGALRAQDVRSAGDPQSFNGDILRIDPDTGSAWPTNPLVGDASPDNDPIIAYGLRNPFRITSRPGTREIWIGDVGWNTWEEIDRIPDPDDAVVENFGWPCVEGATTRPIGYNFLVTLCNIPTSSTTAPYFQYLHNVGLYSGDPCSTDNGSSISGLAFYNGGSYPPGYAGALFFADYSRSCVWVMKPGPDGNPDPSTRAAFLTGASDAQQVGDPMPVDLTVGPGGDLFLADFGTGQVRRIRYDVANTPPSAVIHASPTDGPAPLTVAFDGGGSADADPGSTLFFAWDLDDDGEFDDGNLPTAVWTYDQPGDYAARLRVTDDDGASTVATVTLSAGNTAPVATIDAPSPDFAWRVGDVVPFAGHGDDTNDGSLGAASMDWDIVLHHCESGPGTCHDHHIETADGVDSGTFTAPDHEYYTELVFTLTVTDSGGLTDTRSVTLAPVVVSNSFTTTPEGLVVLDSDFDAPTPFDRPAIVGSLHEVTAPTPQDLAGVRYQFVSWDDGGDPDRSFVAGDEPRVFHATFAACAASETVCDGLDDDCNGHIDDGMAPVTCGTGACERTVAACVDGSPQTCTPGSPAPESCNGVDDDCNGVADDGMAPVTCGTGACERTVAACVDGSPQTCTPGSPAPESCNGVDDDCNGVADDDIALIVCGTGACERTVAACVDGLPQTCTPGSPTPESCNGVDDDCNGLADDVAPPTAVPDLSIDAEGLTWTTVPDADSYDLVQGHLPAGGGDPFTDATTDSCLATRETMTSLSFAGSPGVDEGWWFVIRSRNCGGAGSYDSGDPQQEGSRDSGINASSSSCP